MVTKILTISTQFPSIVEQLLSDCRRLPTKQAYTTVLGQPDGESTITVRWRVLALGPTMGELNTLSWLACAEGCGLIRESVTRIADIEPVDNQ
jgi:hypothetical protein